MKRLHLHLAGLLSMRLAGGQGRRPSPLRVHPGVEGTNQPVKRRVVDQVVHDVVQGVFHSAQLDSAGAQHAVRQIAQWAGLAEADVDLCGGAAEQERLLLDVVGEALQPGDQDQTGGLELLGEGLCQGQGAVLNNLRGGGRNDMNSVSIGAFIWRVLDLSFRSLSYLCPVTILLVRTVGPPRREGGQLVIHHLVSPVNILSAIFNLEKQMFLFSVHKHLKKYNSNYSASLCL